MEGRRSVSSGASGAVLSAEARALFAAAQRAERGLTFLFEAAPALVAHVHGVREDVVVELREHFAAGDARIPSPFSSSRLRARRTRLAT